VVTSALFVSSGSDAAFRPPSQRILGGAISAVQRIPSGRLVRLLGVLAALAAVGGAGAIGRRLRRPGIALSLASLVAISAIGSLRASDGWDEFYINLRHAQNIIAHGAYSANAGERIEATVDLVPFAAAGLVSKYTGVLPDDVAMIVGFAGNAILIVGAFAFVSGMTASTGLALAIAAFVAVFPPLLFVGFSGFMATLFAGLILIALHWLLVRRGRWAFRAYVLLGVLPLVRVEAVALGLLLWGLVVCGSAWRRRQSVRVLWRWMRHTWRMHGARLLAVFTPFVLLTLARLLYFGHAFPVPVVFKNTGGDAGYLFSGALQLRKFYHQFGLAPALLVVAMPLAMFLVARGWRWLSAALAVFLFSLTYLTGGGDWFPESWARYWLPLFAFLIVLSATALHRTLHSWRVPLASLIVAAAFAMFELRETLTLKTAYSDAARFLLVSNPKAWQRVDNLSRLGDHLRRTTDPRWRIATPEVATMIFFAERDLVGLLGIDSWDIARAPLMPMLRGDRLHRRRNPETLLRHRPEVIALYEPAATVPHFKSNVATQRDVQRLLMWDWLWDVAYFRVGSYDFLQALGYHSLTVQEGVHLFTYWVHESVLSSHLTRLAAAGFVPQGSIHMPYTVTDGLTRRYRPAFGPFASLHALRATAVASVASTGAVRANVALPAMAGAPPGTVYATYGVHRSTRGALRLTLTPTTLGELRVPIALGPTEGNVTISVVRSVDASVIQRVPVPQGLSGKWLRLRVRVSADSTPLALVIEDHGRVGGWFAAGAPWWMGEGSPVSK